MKLLPLYIIYSTQQMEPQRGSSQTSRRMQAKLPENSPDLACEARAVFFRLSRWFQPWEAIGASAGRWPAVSTGSRGIGDALRSTANRLASGSLWAANVEWGQPRFFRRSLASAVLREEVKYRRTKLGGMRSNG